VTIVVPVLITSCHVSEKPNIGPVTTQAIITDRAIKKAEAVPVKYDILFEIFLNLFFINNLYFINAYPIVQYILYQGENKEV
jgi:hypothetical protein